MTFVVTDHCRHCRYTDCVAVCPVECFHGDAEMLYIDPVVCIDCGACVPECPVEAIYEEGSLPAELEYLPGVERRHVADAADRQREERAARHGGGARPSARLLARVTRASA